MATNSSSSNQLPDVRKAETKWLNLVKLRTHYGVVCAGTVMHLRRRQLIRIAHALQQQASSERLINIFGQQFVTSATNLHYQPNTGIAMKMHNDISSCTTLPLWFHYSSFIRSRTRSAINAKDGMNYTRGTHFICIDFIDISMAQ